MGYPPPPPPPGTPGGYGPPSGPPPGYGPPPGSPPPPPGGAGYGGPGYGGPPTGGYGGPPPGPAAEGSGSSKGPLIALMAALVVVVLLVVVGGVILVTQGGDEDVELTEAQLRDALVTEGDVGDGFTLEEASDEPDDDFDRDDLDASEECLDLYEDFAEAEGAQPTVEVTATLEGDDGSQVEETLSQGSELGLDAVRDLADTCPEIGFDDGESTGAIRFEILDDVAEVGDDSVTLSVEVVVDEPDITVPSIGVLWERDGVHAGVNVTGALDEETFESSDPDEDLLADVVERADERLAEVIDEA